MAHDFKNKGQLKKIDFEFDDDLITNFSAPKKLKKKEEARCTNGHKMVLQDSRIRGGGWRCDWCRNSYSGSPGFAYY